MVITLHRFKQSYLSGVRFDILHRICTYMNTEIEAKFLNQRHEVIRERLKGIGSVCVAPMRLMRRAIIDYPDRRLQKGTPNAYIRVRDEGDRVTLTYKQFTSLSVSGAQEVDVTVSSFPDTVEIFTSIGFAVVSLQESKRETWRFEDCEVVLDEWPWLNPYIEVEGPTEQQLIALAERLELNWHDAVFGDVMVAYRAQYPHLTLEQTVGNIPEVTFDAPKPFFM